MKADWTEKETLYLLEAIMHYGDDWKRVAQLVGGRSEKECVAQFMKLPFGEQYLKYPNSGEVDNKYNAMKDQVDAGCGLENSGASFPSKRMCLTPLADASNPIMAQVYRYVAVSEFHVRHGVNLFREPDYYSNKQDLRIRNLGQVDDASTHNKGYLFHEHHFVGVGILMESSF